MGRLQRVIVGSSFGVALWVGASASAGAAGTVGCYVGCTPPTVAATSATPPSTASAPVVAGSSSLPFTGADVVELSAVGLGAVVVGGVLARRRRSAP